jgi:SAF domain-containing protein
MSVVEFRSPAPRRVAKPRWLDLRLILGVVLVLTAVLLGAVVVARSHHTQREVAVTRDLAAGTTLRAEDLRVVDAQLPAGTSYLASTADAIGKVLTRALSAGELLPSGALGRQATSATVTVPFAADAAPQLHHGQRIVVWLSTTRCPDVVLLPDVVVQDAHPAEAGAFAGTGSGQDAVLTVSPAWAGRVVAALAIEKAAIRAGVLSGMPADPPPGLRDLSGCADSSAP